MDFIGKTAKDGQKMGKTLTEDRDVKVSSRNTLYITERYVKLYRVP